MLVPCGVIALCVVISMVSVQSAAAQKASSQTVEPETSPVENAERALETDDLDGFYITLGPVMNAVRASGVWDASFGGEALLMRVRERAALSAAGIGLGAARYARAGDRGVDRGSGRVWADFHLATRPLGGPVVGIGIGAAADIDPVIAPRWGAQLTIWAFVGVIPFVRIGTIQKNGAYIDFGIKVALPAVRI